MTACAPKSEPRLLDREAIHQRAYAQFTSAILFKPLETGPTNYPGFDLAPLLVQEVINTNTTVEPPMVFFTASEVMMNGKPHGQFTYFWRSRTLPGAASSEWVTQGVRITLNSSGFPTIWEVLADDSGGELIFVSQSLETAALEAFGPPLAGRRFAVERSLEAAPKVIVARVIDDGPVAMGPIVHLAAGSHRVSTLVCRCMPTQAKELVGTQTYALRPLSELRLRPAFDKLGEDAAARLQRCLRLPSDF